MVNDTSQVNDAQAQTFLNYFPEKEIEKVSGSSFRKLRSFFSDSLQMHHFINKSSFIRDEDIVGLAYKKSKKPQLRIAHKSNAQEINTAQKENKASLDSGSTTSATEGISDFSDTVESLSSINSILNEVSAFLGKKESIRNFRNNVNDAVSSASAYMSVISITDSIDELEEESIDGDIKAEQTTGREIQAEQTNKYTDGIEHMGNSNMEDVTESDFLQWLKSTSNKKSSDSQATEENTTQKSHENEELDQSNKENNNSERTDSSEEMTLNSPESEKTDEKVQKESGNTSKDKKKALKNLISKSNELGDDVISETLAELLAHHGHQSRAIEMYEKLSLLNPEKSVYFADQIKKLNNKD